MPGPTVLRLATEIAAVGELGAFTMSAPLMKWWLPRGDWPVFVMPGFLAGDGSTLPLRRTLDRLGHITYGWGLGRDFGPAPEILDGIVKRVDELHQEHGSIDVVGWSLGGIFGRELARVAPHATWKVITMGSPFQI